MHELPFRVIVTLAALGQEFYGLASVKELIDERKKPDSIYAYVLSIPSLRSFFRTFSILIYPYTSLISRTVDVFVYNIILFIYIDTSPYGNLRRAQRILENVIVISWIPGISSIIVLILNLLYYHTCLIYYPYYLQRYLNDFVDVLNEDSANFANNDRSSIFLSLFIQTFHQTHIACTTKDMKWYGLRSRIEAYKFMRSVRYNISKKSFHDYSSCASRVIREDLTKGIPAETANNVLILFAFIFHISIITTTIKHFQYLCQKSYNVPDIYPHLSKRRLSIQLLIKMITLIETRNDRSCCRIDRHSRRTPKRSECQHDEDEENLEDVWRAAATRMSIMSWLTGRTGRIDTCTTKTAAPNVCRTESEPSIAFFSATSEEVREESFSESRHAAWFLLKKPSRLFSKFHKRQNTTRKSTAVPMESSLHV